MMKAKYLGKKQETPTDWTFYFEKPADFNYLAGQYAVLRIPLKYEDPRGNSRTCSTSSSPTEDSLHFTFTMRSTGFKNTLKEMEEGVEIELFPPRGKMILEIVDQPHCLMIAGGIGVAPYRGIAKFAADTNYAGSSLTLLYSDKTIEELAFKKEFDEITSAYPNFKAVYTLTRHTEDSGEWIGNQGRINNSLIENCIKDFEKTLFMVCGPVEMVRGTMLQLEQMGVPRERIVIELFTGY